VLLCGDLNVDSAKGKRLLNDAKNEILQKKSALSKFEEAVFENACNEHDSMLHILSNLGTEKITDCFQENIHNNEI